MPGTIFEINGDLMQQVKHFSRKRRVLGDGVLDIYSDYFIGPDNTDIADAVELHQLHEKVRAEMNGRAMTKREVIDEAVLVMGNLLSMAGDTPITSYLHAEPQQWFGAYMCGMMEYPAIPINSCCPEQVIRDVSIDRLDAALHKRFSITPRSEENRVMQIRSRLVSCLAADELLHHDPSFAWNVPIPQRQRYGWRMALLGLEADYLLLPKTADKPS